MASFTGIVRDSGCKRKGLLHRQYKDTVNQSEALEFGKAYHESIENGIEGGIESLKNTGLLKYKDMLVDMYERLTKVLIQEGITIIENEVKFEVNKDELAESFIGYIDAIAEKDGEVYLVEFKTSKGINVASVPVDAQVTSYLWACREIGDYNPKGVIYIVNNKRKNKKPLLLKNGHLSASKSQGCTFDEYEKAIYERYISKDENVPVLVEANLNWLKDNEKPDIVVVYTSRTEEQLNIFGNMLYQLVKESNNLKELFYEKGIEQALRETPCFPHKFCMMMCPYKEECITHLTQGV